jgi:hypothetical protein
MRGIAVDPRGQARMFSNFAGAIAGKNAAVASGPFFGVADGDFMNAEFCPAMDNS